MPRIFPCFLTAGFLLGTALAQPPAQPLKFDVTSIKPANPDAGQSSMTIDPGGNLNVTNMPLRAVIRFAYDIRGFQLSSGPGWIGTERYDIAGKPARGPHAAEPEAEKEMVRGLLADRFGLVVHHETKEQQVYVLSVARNGPKLKVSTTPGNRQGTGTDPGRIRGFSATIPMFVSALSNEMGR